MPISWTWGKNAINKSMELQIILQGKTIVFLLYLLSNIQIISCVKHNHVIKLKLHRKCSSYQVNCQCSHIYLLKTKAQFNNWGASYSSAVSLLQCFFLIVHKAQNPSLGLFLKQTWRLYLYGNNEIPRDNLGTSTL